VGKQPQELTAIFQLLGQRIMATITWLNFLLLLAYRNSDPSYAILAHNRACSLKDKY
jgi:hypothetical protein